MDGSDYNLASHSAIPKYWDKKSDCAAPNWKMGRRILPPCGKFCWMAARNKTNFMDRRQTGTYPLHDYRHRGPLATSLFIQLAGGDSDVAEVTAGDRRFHSLPQCISNGEKQWSGGSPTNLGFLIEAIVVILKL